MNESAPAAPPAKALSAAEKPRHSALDELHAVLAAARAQRGAAAVVQADVDLAADALVDAGIRPYVQLLARLTGGSFSTLTPMFEDWWQRFAARRADPERAALLSRPLRATLHLRHLLGALEDAVRAELGLEEAQRPVLNAMQTAEIAALKSEVRALKAQLQARSLAESNTLTEQVKKLEAQRERLQKELEGMTYQVTHLTEQLDARVEASRAQEAAQREAIRGLVEQFARLEALLSRAANTDDALARVSAGLERLHRQIVLAKPTAPSLAQLRRAPRRQRGGPVRSAPAKKKAKRGRRHTRRK